MCRACHDHPQGVSHVTFSIDGSLVATCGHDAVLRVSKAERGELLLEEDLYHRFAWTTATKVKCHRIINLKTRLLVQVQFNISGSLLMVSGVLKKDIMHRQKGEVIIFQLVGEDEGEIRSRISIK